MISVQAKNSFDHIFRKAVMDNLVSTDDYCEIQLINNALECSEKKIAVLTISAPYFRFLLIFHFNVDASIQNYFVKQSEVEAGSPLDNAACRDAFLEFCNLCCGSINREFLKVYPHLGMSTPYILYKESSSFISALNPGYASHYKIDINHSLILHATLCICDFGNVDFNVDTSVIEEDTGELELF